MVLATAVFATLPAVVANAAVACATVGVAARITLASGDSVTVGRDVAGNFSVSGTGLAPSTGPDRRCRTEIPSASPGRAAISP